MRVKTSVPGIATAMLLVLLVVVAVLGSIKTNNQIWLASPAEAVDTRITIAGHPPQPHRGLLYFTFVREEPANVLTQFYYQHFDPNASIVPNVDIYGTANPSQQQQQQQEQQNVAYMADSKQAAQVAAFNALGHRVEGEQVSIAYVDPHSKAVGKLRVNDVIVAVNGHTIHTSQELRQIVQPLHPGTPVALTILRSLAHRLRRLTLSIITVRSQASGKAAIGIIPHITFSSDPQKHLPYRVTINTDNIEGPSAGLMFALGIVNRLSPVDITHGHKIAGTGEIDADGNVGPIGGVKQKVIGARSAGAEYFFVPATCVPQVCNYTEAKPYAQGIKLVPVSTLSEALDFLKRLR